MPTVPRRCEIQAQGRFKVRGPAMKIVKLRANQKLIIVLEHDKLEVQMYSNAVLLLSGVL